ncbi:MAG: Peptidyl-prolyl cis-trans isomerase [Parcubacteria group bacterium GW2011_GWA2_42_35]|nr:MAG: Peptidyl-prolyl cis-trans isomerase [Parcubacteria group bacterium GW2011_GWA2_42_35]
MEKGNGAAAKNGDTIVVHYIGTLENGTKFDSSLDRGRPFSFVLGAGQVIAGWEQGILGMRIGEKRKLTIAPELAYGEAGAGNAIPPNATLIFEINLLEIK